MIKLIEKFLNKNKKEEKVELENIKVEEVKPEPYYVNTPYESEEVYSVFYKAIYNGFVTVERYNQHSFAPKFFEGVYQGIRFKINANQKQTWLRTYEVILKDEETDTVLAIGGEQYWGHKWEDPTRKFRSEHKIKNNNFYVMQPNTSMARYIIELIEELTEYNRKADALKQVEKNVEQKRKQEQEMQKFNHLDEKYKEKLNQA